MNNATNEVSEVGQLARGLICDGLEVNAEIAAEEPSYGRKGLDEGVHRLVKKYGAKAVLEAFHDAACGAAETHEDMDEDGMDLASLRLRMFCRKIDAAIKTLR